MAQKAKVKVKDWTPVDPYGVLVADKDKNIFIGGEKLTEADLKNLKEEVKIIKNLRVWRIMQETVRQKAIDKGLIESLDWQDTLAAKMMLHNLGILRSIVKVIEDKQIGSEVTHTSYAPRKFGGPSR